jgi:subtilisin family serine protease
MNSRSCSLEIHVGLFACVSVTTIMACADLPDAIGTSRQQALGAKDHAYYTYDGRPVYLNIDPTHITLSAAAGVSAAAVRSSLTAVGLDGMQTEQSSTPGEVFDVILPAGASTQGALDVVARLRSDKTLRFVANSYRTQEEGYPIALHDRLMVHLQDGEGAEAIARLNRDFGTRLIREPLSKSGEYLLEYPPGVDPLEFALTIGDQPEVAWVDPDKRQARKLHAIPTDPYYANQYYAHNTTSWNGVSVDDNAEFAWDLTGGSWAPSAGPFVVAVLDGGVEIAHPDLGSSFVLGFDAFNNSWSSFGCTNCATNPDGDDSHGTEVAGIIKSLHNNGIGVGGLAPDVTLLPIRIFQGGVSGTDSQIALGIDAAWQNNAQVLNNSWGGGGPSNAITAAISRATTQGRGGRGAVVVFAAGNTSIRQSGIIGPVTFPATLSTVIAVGAIDRDGLITDYSPEGSELDIVAPSGHFTGHCIGDVVTTDLLGPRGCNDGPLGDVDYSSTFSGTSAAAPQVASVAAMIISRSPTLTEAQVRSAITSNADPWGPAVRFGAGKLNAYRSLVGRLHSSISGNMSPVSPGTYPYTVTASGGVGGYTYQWSMSKNGSVFVSTCSNGPSCSVSVTRDVEIELRVTITNGPDNQQVTASTFIDGPSSRPSCGPLKAC